MANLIDLNSTAHVQPSTTETFALDVLMGLSTEPKQLSPKYLYDEIGSELFKDITDCKDYYPTNCEYEILDTHKSEIAELAKSGNLNVIELGAGDGRKTQVLIKEMLGLTDTLSYCPIDISRTANEELVDKFSKQFPKLKITGLMGDYFRALTWIRENQGGKNLVLFLGSNIGNFSLVEAAGFLRTMWNSLNDGDLALIGFDFKKDIDIMLNAYNDSNGITKNFNLNLLDRMNKELGANFDRKKFTHYGTFNVHIGAMESFLVSLEAQEVFIGELNKTFTFKAYEPVHVEYSFKFLPRDIETLATETGFSLEKLFYDSKHYFTDALLKVSKEKR